MGSVHSLLVYCGVPVTVVEDDGVRRSEVDAETPRPRAQQEHEDVVAALEVRHHVPTLGDLAAAIQPDVGVLTVAHVLLQQVDHPGHLGVDEHPVSALLQPGQQPVQHAELASIRNQTLAIRNDHT